MISFIYFRALVGNVNYFGGPGTTCAKYSSHLEELEQSNAGAMIVIISDLWLDKIQVCFAGKGYFTFGFSMA